MKKLLLSIVLTTVMTLFFSETKAQYKNALGVRLGDSYGVTFKTFLRPDRALDFILNVKDRHTYSVFRLTGLYEQHLPVNLEGLPGLRWYYGGGGTIGSFHDKRTDASQFYLSADGVIGLDYKFNGAPINLSLDWKPALELTPETDFDARGVGLSVRITF